MIITSFAENTLKGCSVLWKHQLLSLVFCFQEKRLTLWDRALKYWLMTTNSVWIDLCSYSFQYLNWVVSSQYFYLWLLLSRKDTEESDIDLYDWSPRGYICICNFKLQYVVLVMFLNGQHALEGKQNQTNHILHTQFNSGADIYHLFHINKLSDKI